MSDAVVVALISLGGALIGVSTAQYNSNSKNN